METVLDCPFCGKSKHLYLNEQKQVYHCFKCHASGRAAELRQEGYIPNRNPLILTAEEESVNDGSLTPPPVTAELTEEGLNYLRSRRVSPSFFSHIRSTPKGLYFQFPDETYWQERRWEQFAPPRWKNPHKAPITPAKGVTYHLTHDRACDTIVLVEGVFDALVVASHAANAAAMLSSKYHEAQMERLISRWGYRSAVLLFDQDVSLDSRITTLLKAGALFTQVKTLDIQAKDPAEMSTEKLTELKEVVNAL